MDRGAHCSLGRCLRPNPYFEGLLERGRLAAFFVVAGASPLPFSCGRLRKDRLARPRRGLPVAGSCDPFVDEPVRWGFVDDCVELDDALGGFVGAEARAARHTVVGWDAAPQLGFVAVVEWGFRTAESRLLVDCERLELALFSDEILRTGR